MAEATIDWTETIGRARRWRRIYRIAIGLADVAPLFIGAVAIEALSSREEIPPVVPVPSATLNARQSEKRRRGSPRGRGRRARF
jgi:hypothetical protein